MVCLKMNMSTVKLASSSNFLLSEDILKSILLTQYPVPYLSSTEACAYVGFLLHQ